jgi:hypothetical protein
MSEFETNDIENQETPSPELENQGIHDFLNSVSSKQYSAAESQFKDLLDDRVQTALDQTRIRLANNIFNATEESEEDLADELEVSGEETE